MWQPRGFSSLRSPHPHVTSTWTSMVVWLIVEELDLCSMDWSLDWWLLVGVIYLNPPFWKLSCRRPRLASPTWNWHWELTTLSLSGTQPRCFVGFRGFPWQVPRIHSWLIFWGFQWGPHLWPSGMSIERWIVLLIGSHPSWQSIWVRCFELIRGLLQGCSVMFYFPIFLVAFTLDLHEYPIL